jgi:ethanolamine ammonia-lyase small subunit
MSLLPSDKIIQTDPWQSLRAFTAARIALGRTGAALPLKETLDLRLAHAHARDAVYSLLNRQQLNEQFISLGLPFIELKSMARDRAEYLQRPDLGRMVEEEKLESLKKDYPEGCDVLIILADGLSATAINKHAFPLLKLLLEPLASIGFKTGPLVLIEQARVAVGDPVSQALGAKLSLVFIGERPGLSSPDSLGVYLTYAPRPGLTDESRNCISNIRPEGLVYEAAVQKILYLVAASFKLGLSGVMLKDDALLAGNL